MSDFKRKILEPLMLPLAGFLFVGAVGFGLSRILLATTKDWASGVALVASIVVIVGCAAVAARGFRLPEKAAAVTAFVLTVAGGSVFAATLGIRPVHKFTPEPSATIVALDGASTAGFVEKELTVPAQDVTVVRFDNKDTQQPHNWAVVQSEQNRGTVIVPGGAPFLGPAVRDYVLNQVAAGSYFYFCEVHPATMTGTLIVGDAAPAAPGTGGTPAPGGSPAASPTSTTSAFAVEPKRVKLSA